MPSGNARISSGYPPTNSLSRRVLSGYQSFFRECRSGYRIAALQVVILDGRGRNQGDLLFIYIIICQAILNSYTLFEANQIKKPALIELVAHYALVVATVDQFNNKLVAGQHSEFRIVLRIDSDIGIFGFNNELASRNIRIVFMPILIRYSYISGSIQSSESTKPI